MPYGCSNFAFVIIADENEKLLNKLAEFSKRFFCLQWNYWNVSVFRLK